MPSHKRNNPNNIRSRRSHHSRVSRNTRRHGLIDRVGSALSRLEAKMAAGAEHQENRAPAIRSRLDGIDHTAPADDAGVDNMGLTAGGNAGSRIDDYGMRDNGRRVEAELIAAKNIEEPHVDDGQNAAIRKEAAAMVESIMARVRGESWPSVTANVSTGLIGIPRSAECLARSEIRRQDECGMISRPVCRAICRTSSRTTSRGSSPVRSSASHGNHGSDQITEQPSAIIGGRAMWHGLLLGELDAVQVMIDDYCGSEASSLLEGGQACISAGQPCRASQSNLAAEQMMTPAEMAAHAAEVGVPVEHVRIFAGHYDMLAARAKLREAEIRIAGRHGEESGRERRIEAKSKPSRLWGCFRGLCFWLKSKSSISRASSSSSFVAPAPTAEVEAPHGGRPSTLSAASTQADGVSGDADSHQSRGGRQGRKLSDLFSRAVWWRKRSDAGKAAATQPQQQPCSA